MTVCRFAPTALRRGRVESSVTTAGLVLRLGATASDAYATVKIDQSSSGPKVKKTGGAAPYEARAVYPPAS